MGRTDRAAGDGLPAGGVGVESLPGVGPRLALKLAAAGMSRIQDLWLHLPLRYEDRTRLVPIQSVVPGTTAQVEGRVDAVERGFRYRPNLRVTISDGSKASLLLRFFHFRASQAAQFQPGVRVRAYGAVRTGGRGLEIVHPSYRLLDDDAPAALSERLDPVYPAIEGIGPAMLSRLVGAALQRLPPAEDLELLPAGLLGEPALPGLRASLEQVHRPPPQVELDQLLGGCHPAQQRLALEELLAHTLSLRRQRIRVQECAAWPARNDGRLAERLRARLPFTLTPPQLRVYEEIRADLALEHPMLRLVQGDVGSGKTVVAALAALVVVQSGHQVALLAPTELLAEQHLDSLRAWFGPLGVEVAWLAGKVTGRQRRATLEAIREGRAQVVVGTHALMQEGVDFKALALCLVDEQQRFGVHQRLALRDKGRDAGRLPHQLVTTATPIPRTLAMTAYADLSISVIDELPPGRIAVRTVAVSTERRDEVVARIRAACGEGRQAYWVCTLIDESAEVSAQAASSRHLQLCDALPGLRVGLVHGRMKAGEKQAVMRAFKEDGWDVLVATTVIEVGVDVPNASLMVIENAERLGLAQLHQLRGRVGRGARASTCVLLYQPPLSSLARQRIETLRVTGDGFRIAEKDLELRGPGELLGTRQTGLVQFRVADPVRDAGLLPRVHALADSLLRDHPDRADAIIDRWIGASARFAGA